MTREITIDVSTLRVALPDDHDPAKPFPLTIRRDFENPNCWATGDGDKIFTTREWAEKSMELDSPEYRERSRLRMEYSQLVKAEPTTEAGWVFFDGCGHNEGYFDSVDELREHCECEDIPAPAWCHTTIEQAFSFDVFDALDSYLSDEHHEDARDQVKGWDELEVFWTAWKAKQTLKSFYPDYSKIVVIDEAAYQAELAAAKAWLADQVQS